MESHRNGIWISWSLVKLPTQPLPTLVHDVYKTTANLLAYQVSFDAHPNRTLALTGGCLNALGDVVAQVAQITTHSQETDKNPKYDPRRTLRFFAYGLAISPVMGRWNLLLERRFPLRSIKGSNNVSFKALGKRVAADQLIMAPIGLAAFLGSMGLMEGRDPRQIRERFRDLYQTALIANWKVWPVAQFVNFRFMPLAYRVPFSQACGVFWTLYLSILNSEEGNRQDEHPTQNGTSEGAKTVPTRA